MRQCSPLSVDKLNWECFISAKEKVCNFKNNLTKLIFLFLAFNTESFRIFDDTLRASYRIGREIWAVFGLGLAPLLPGSAPFVE